MKIDTEGHEYRCLLGLFLKPGMKVKYIQLEQHNDDLYANKVSNDTLNTLLNKNNYFLCRTIK